MWVGESKGGRGREREGRDGNGGKQRKGEMWWKLGVGMWPWGAGFCGQCKPVAVAVGVG